MVSRSANVWIEWFSCLGMLRSEEKITTLSPDQLVEDCWEHCTVLYCTVQRRPVLYTAALAPWRRQSLSILSIYTLCFPAVENLHDDQRSISCNALDWPTCFSMILPHFLNIYQIFINFIEQRRLFFWVLSRLLKNFARKSSTSCLVLWQK